jgi:uncharacterized protein YhfF
MSQRIPKRYQQLRTFAFGDSGALADQLLELVIKGVKTATCSTEDEPNTSAPGERWIVLDGRGEPPCVIETTEVTYRRLMRSTPTLHVMRARETGVWPIGAMRTGPISAGSEGSAKT